MPTQKEEKKKKRLVGNAGKHAKHILPGKSTISQFFPACVVVWGVWAHPSDGYRAAMQEDLSKHCTFYIQSPGKKQLPRGNFHTVHRALESRAVLLGVGNRWPGWRG